MKARRAALLLGLIMNCTLTSLAGAEEADPGTMEAVEVMEAEPAFGEETQAEEVQAEASLEEETAAEENSQGSDGSETAAEDSKADEATAAAQAGSGNGDAEDAAGTEDTADTDADEDTDKDADEDTDAEAEEGSADKFLDIVSCTAVRKDGTITVTLETAKAGYDRLYFGEAADSDKTKTFTGKANDQGGYTFTFQITEDLLGTVVPCVPGSTDGTWYTEEDLLLTLPSKAEEAAEEENTDESTDASGSDTEEDNTDGSTDVSGSDAVVESDEEETDGSEKTSESAGTSGKKTTKKSSTSESDDTYSDDSEEDTDSGSTSKSSGSSSSKKSKSSGSSSSGKSKRSSGSSSSKGGSSSKSSGSLKSSGSSSRKKTGDTSGITAAADDKEKTSTAESVMSGALTEEESAPEIDGLVYVGTYDNRYAELFRLHVYEDDYYVLEIDLSEEADWGGDIASYLIVPAGLEAPENLPEGMETVQLTEEESGHSGQKESSEETESAEENASTGSEKKSRGSSSSEETGSSDTGGSSGRGNALERYRENVEKLELAGFVDRSAEEADEKGESEWIIAYGALLGKLEKAMGYLEELL